MILREIMTQNVKVIPRTASVRDAAKLMKDLDVGVVPVIENRQVVGMITDRDIVTRSTAEGRNPNETQVGEIMTAEFYSCYEEQDVKEAAKLMRDKQIRRLPIINRAQELVGIISLGDLSVDADEKLAGKALEDISKPAKPG